MYMKESGCLGRLFGLVGALLILAGVIIAFPVVKGAPNTQGLAAVDVSLLVAGFVILVLVKKTAPYKWFRKL
jgi:hypothetical protein